jgi:hypothetical protein
MSEIPAPERFFLEVAPYESFEIGDTGHVGVLQIMFYSGTLDTYCVGCGRETVFQSQAPQPSIPVGSKSSKTFTIQELLESSQAAYFPILSFGGPMKLADMGPVVREDRVFHVIFSCPRETNHRLHFIFQVHNNRIAKIGQSPALADLHLAETRKYRKVLGDQKYREFARGVGLYAHGVGIGAFVYLRRILEDLVDQAEVVACKGVGWDHEAFDRGRMDEKILMLKGELPEFLVESRGLYSILSKGIHDLTEEECLAAFPVVRTGIELILDERLERQEREAKIERTRKDLARIRKDLKTL